MLLSDAIDHYKADKLAKGAAKTTIKNEGVTLRQLLATTGNIQLHYLTVHHIDRLLAAFPEWKASTFNLKRTHLTTFFAWCRTRGYMKSDPLEGLKSRRKPQVQRQLVPQAKFVDLLDAAERPRDRAIVALSLYLFTRGSETVELRWRDIDFQNKEIIVWRRKTQESDVLPMCSELEEELTRWHFEYGRQAGTIPSLEWYVVPAYTRPVWTGKRGAFEIMAESIIQPTIKLQSVTEQVKGVLDQLGYDGDREGGHTLRRSGATALYHELSRMGHDRAVRTVQTMLGHKSIATTEVYLSLNLDRKARNDLLAGRRMFQSESEGSVIQLGVASGQENSGTVRV